MQGLYTAIGRIASAAHANGDTIDENIFRSESGHNRHGLDIYHKGRLFRFRDVPDEPRFTVGCPFAFSSYLRNEYTAEELSDRADVDMHALEADEREGITESVLRSDLEEIAAFEEDVQTAIRAEFEPTQLQFAALRYGEEEYWNGIVIQDRIFPYKESFGVMGYRTAVDRVYCAYDELLDLLMQEVPPLNEHSGSRSSQNEKGARPSAFE